MTAPVLPVRMNGARFEVETTGLSKRYGATEALREVDVQVPEGAVYVLVGPNGAGKSTLIRTLLDLTRASAGGVRVFGLDPRERGPEIRAAIGYVPERHDWGYGWMRVERLLDFHAAYYPRWDSHYADRLVRFFELPLGARYGKLSKGMARRVQLLLALAHRPRLLVLDEPTDGLDPVVRDETLGMLADHLADTPTTALISTHHVHETERLADTIGVLREGQLRAQLPVSELRRHLRSYQISVPEGWQGSPELNGAVLKRRENAREIRWTIWGEEREIVERLISTGGTVREASPLSLEEATLALLTRRTEALP